MKSKNVIILLTLLFLLLSCKTTPNKSDLYQRNFEKYIQMQFPNHKIEEESLYILIPHVSCGFCLDVTTDFLRNKKRKDIFIITSRKENWMSRLEYSVLEDSSVELLSQLNLKTQKGPSFVMYEGGKLVYIESITHKTYKSIFKLIDEN